MDDRNAYDAELSGYPQRRSPEERVRLDAEVRAQSYQDPAEADAVAQARAHPQGQAQADSSAQTVVAPTPRDDQLATFTARIDQLLGDVQSRNASSIVTTLTGLRSEARDRELRWQRNITGGQTRSLDEMNAIKLKGASDRDRGWAMLRQRDGVEAQRLFLLALWADTNDAEAWFGYGAAQGTRDMGSAAIAMGVLHFPDAAQARALRAEAEPMLYARGLPGAEVDGIFEDAAASANALRYATPHGQARNWNEFAWR